MVLEKIDRCIKMELPNAKFVDILSPVFTEISKWLQNGEGIPESGGYVVGYQHERTGNISLEHVSHPYSLDIKTRTRFDIRDSQHDDFLSRAKKQKSYYMGVWHTHPQLIPSPSEIDWNDWNETMRLDKTGCEYIFFIIAGTDEIRVWVGDTHNKKISEIYECQKNDENIYLKQMGKNE